MSSRLYIHPSRSLSYYYGTIVKLRATGKVRDNTSLESFFPYYYARQDGYVYGYVEAPHPSQFGGYAQLRRLSHPDQVPGVCALLPANLGIEYTLEIVSKEDCWNILGLITNHKYKIEYGTCGGYSTQQFIKQLSN